MDSRKSRDLILKSADSLTVRKPCRKSAVTPKLGKSQRALFVGYPIVRFSIDSVAVPVMMKCRESERDYNNADSAATETRKHGVDGRAALYCAAKGACYS